jgi:hypothetical protein
MSAMIIFIRREIAITARFEPMYGRQTAVTLLLALQIYKCYWVFSYI